MIAALLLAFGLATACAAGAPPPTAASAELLGMPLASPEVVDLLRVAYEESGDAAYVRRIIDALPWEEGGERRRIVSTAADLAGMYLVYAAQDDDRVLGTCRDEAGRRTGLVRTQLLGIVEHAETMRARAAEAVE